MDMVELQSQPDQTPAPGSLARGVFVGRQRELTVLQQRVDATFHSKGSLVFITGEAGIGKTRLAWEVRPYARSRGFLWLEGRYLRDENIPFQAWVEAIRASLLTALRCGAGEAGARSGRGAERSAFVAGPWP